MQVVADVGIVGVPNAGKSTLLSVVTSARPKIANYPFTTLVPNLGVCEMDYRTTVFADIPGLLEVRGAAVLGRAPADVPATGADNAGLWWRMLQCCSAAVLAHASLAWWRWVWRGGSCCGL